MQQSTEPGPVGVEVRGTHSLRVQISTSNQRQSGQAHLAPFPGLLQQLPPDSRLMTCPALKAVIRALQARGDISRHQRPLNQQGTGTAHRIEQRTAGCGNLWPPGPKQNGGSKILLQRRQNPFGAIAPAMKTNPREVDAESRLVLVQMKINPHIGTLHINGRPRAATLAKPVDNSVFDLEGGVLRMANLGPSQLAGNRQGTLGRKMLLPRQKQRFSI